MKEIAEVVTAYSGDPDSRGERMLRAIPGVELPPVGTKLVALGDHDIIVMRAVLADIAWTAEIAALTQSDSGALIETLNTIHREIDALLPVHQNLNNLGRYRK